MRLALDFSTINHLFILVLFTIKSTEHSIHVDHPPLVLNCTFSGCHGKSFEFNTAGGQLSLKLMCSRFLPLLTPVVFTARLSSGRLRPARKKRRQMRTERGERPSKFMSLQFLPQTQPVSQWCFHFAPLHAILPKSKQTVCKLRHFHWQQLLSGILQQTC